MIYVVRESIWWIIKIVCIVFVGWMFVRLVKERVGFFNKCVDLEKYFKGGGGGGEEYFCLLGGIF